MLKFIGLGEVLWDVTLPERISQPGGAPANVAFYASQFGNQGIIASAVGADQQGRELVSALSEGGLSVQFIQANAHPTGSVYVFKHPDGGHRYQIARDVAWDCIAFTEDWAGLAEQADCVVFGTLAQRSRLSRGAIQRFLEDAPSGKGKYKVFDINLRQHFYTVDVIVSSLHRCNVLKINHEELEAIAPLLKLKTDVKGLSAVECFGKKEAARCRRSCLELSGLYPNLEIILLTCGDKGSFTFSADGFHHKKAMAIQKKEPGADTVGAGDSFTAAFISALLAGQPVKQAQRSASRVAAYVCSKRGAMHRLPQSLCRL